MNLHKMRCAILAAACLALGAPAIAKRASPSASIWTINTSEVQQGKLEQARRYFAAGWLPARREALKRGYIRSYRLLMTPKMDDKNPEFVLITEYPDQAAYRDREAHFDILFNELKIPRAIEVDGLKRADIFGSVAGAEDYTEVAAGSGLTQRARHK